MVCMDAEMVVKKEMCCFYGKLGENVANQNCGWGQWSDILYHTLCGVGLASVCYIMGSCCCNTEHL